MNVAAAITMPVSKAPMQENSIASIITLIIAPSPIVLFRQIGLVPLHSDYDSLNVWG
jgi:hypothetical protein